MAQYAYDFDFLDNGTAAPQRVPYSVPKKVPDKKPELKPLKKKRSKQEVLIKEKASENAVKKFFAGVLAFILLAGIICYSFAAVKTSQYSMMGLEKEKVLQYNNYLEKCAELNTLVTPDKITDIAVGKLGMIKVSDENKLYVGSNSENVIIVSSDEKNSD